MTICFFEDEKAKSLAPLTLTRPVDDLRVGVITIHEKWGKALGADQVSRILPEHLEGVFPKGEINANDPCLWLNARYMPNQYVLDQIQKLSTGEKITFGEDIVAALVEGSSSVEMFETRSFSAGSLVAIPLDKAVCLEHLWDMISLNSSQIKEDLPRLNLRKASGMNLESNPLMQNSEQIYIASNVTIEPGCIFIADDGPIIIQEGATIEAGSILRGPVAICEGATVKAAARISGGTTIGPVCKVGGEVSSSIFHSYSNKGHDGYVGNSIFGQWVNLGADTNTSNLKNNYKNVEIIDWVTKESRPTDQQFLGTIMADHSKTAINTMLNTGTMCGVSSNLFVAQFPPKIIESFTWLGPEGPALYRFDKAVEVMEMMMKRRDVELTDAYRDMMQYVMDQR